jgi:hypothetical protein
MFWDKFWNSDTIESKESVDYNYNPWENMSKKEIINESNRIS